MPLLLPTLLLLLAAILLLGIRVLFVKGGKFPSGHAHDIETRRREFLQRKEKQPTDKK